MAANASAPILQSPHAKAWTEVARQPVQRVCHIAECQRRTFYWILEAVKGKPKPICKKCVEFRAVAEATAESMPLATVSKKRKSANEIADFAEVAAPEPDYGVDEEDIERQIMRGRITCASMIPQALAAIQHGFRKGDGQLGVRFLEGVGVIGQEHNKRQSAMKADAHLQDALQSLIGGGQAGDGVAITAEKTTVKTTLQIESKSPEESATLKVPK